VFSREARVVGLLALTILAYACSFHDLAGELLLEKEKLEGYGWIAVVAPLALVAVAGPLRHASRLRARPLTLCAWIAAPVLLLGLVLGGEVAAAVTANVVLAALVFAAVTSAARKLTRGPFWYGSLLGGLVIASRFVEFETDLWLKALVFLACGVAVIVFGIGFERRLSRAV